MSPEDDSDNLQQNMQLQPLASISTSSSDFGFLDTSTTGMFKIIMFSFTYDICVYICLIFQIMKIDYLILYKRINYVSYNTTTKNGFVDSFPSSRYGRLLFIYVIYFSVKFVSISL